MRFSHGGVSIMQITIGRSGNSNIAVAVNEATANIRNPVFIIFMVPENHLQEASYHICRNYPDAQVVGLSCMSYLGKFYSDSSCTIIAFDNTFVVQTGIIHKLSTCPLYSLTDFHQKLINTDPGNTDTICLCLATQSDNRLSTTLNIELDEHDIPLIGGSIATGDSFDKCIFINGNEYRDSAFYAFIRNTHGTINVMRSRNEKIGESVQNSSNNPGFIFLINNAYKHAMFHQKHILDRMLQSLTNLSIEAGMVMEDTLYKNLKPDKGIVCAVFEFDKEV